MLFIGDQIYVDGHGRYIIEDIRYLDDNLGMTISLKRRTKLEMLLLKIKKNWRNLKVWIFRTLGLKCETCGVASGGVCPVMGEVSNGFGCHCWLPARFNYK